MLNLYCPSCKKSWSEDMPLPMVASAAVVRFKAMDICIHCGKKGVRLGEPGYETPKKDLSK